MGDIPSDSAYLGTPATPAREQMVKQAAFARLPAMRKQLQSLQKLVDQLASQQREPAAQDAAWTKLSAD